MLHPPGPVFFIAPTQHITPGVVNHFKALRSNRRGVFSVSGAVSEAR